MRRTSVNYLRGRLLNWWRAPSFLDQFESIQQQEDVLELTEELSSCPFTRFKQVTDAAAR